MPQTTDSQTLPLDLGDGLVLRRATKADTQALVDFNGKIHAEGGNEREDKVAEWTRDLMEKPHPTFEVGDFTIVEDTEKGKIVSTLNLISQTWAYGGIPFGVGRPELVGTDPDYRHRGLVRAQFDVIHRWSAARGELLQGITGIPYYYRIFGYEMGLDLGGGRVGYPVLIPKLKEDQEEPYLARPAEEADLPFIQQVYASSLDRYLVSAVWDEDLFRYELQGKSEFNVNRSTLEVVTTPEGERVAFLAHAAWLWGPTVPVTRYEVREGVSWAEVTPSVVRYLRKLGETYAERDEGEFGAFAFWLGSDHPVYHVIDDRLPRTRKPYAWYVRIPDLPGFLTHIRPVLEQKLADSPLAGHSGELKISFYRDGLRLKFERGRLVEVAAWVPEPFGHSGDAGFPGLTFLQLLMGYRSLAELKYAFADCWTDGDEAAALLEALFPKQLSDVWPVS